MSALLPQFLAIFSCSLIGEEERDIINAQIRFLFLSININQSTHQYCK
jgi:hypothetical protein